MTELLAIWLWIATFITIGVLAKVANRRRAAKDQMRIRNWAEFHDYEIIGLRRSRFVEFLWLGCSSTQQAYRARSKISNGEEWECWVIIGGVFNPFSRDLNVRWDEGPSLSVKP